MYSKILRACMICGVLWGSAFGKTDHESMPKDSQASKPKDKEVKSKEAKSQKTIIKTKQNSQISNDHNNTAQDSHKTDSKKQDDFLTHIILQDTENILDPLLPLPYLSLPHTTKQPTAQQDLESLFNTLNPNHTTYDYSKHKRSPTTKEAQEIPFQIHELEKEAYMLKSQLIALEQNKKAWLINPNRSGYYIGIGIALGFHHNAKSLGIDASSAGAGGILRLGYVRYVYNNLGIRAELFRLYGNGAHNNELVWYSHYGLRFSILHDIPVFFENQHFGFFAGFGAGSYLFAKKIHTNDTYAFLTQHNGVGMNFHIGASWSYTKHHRIEIERIFMNPLVTLTQAQEHNYEPSYIVSYSWVF